MACLEREAGYILLGSLCASLPAALVGRPPAELLALFEPALGADAATELDRRYCSNVVRTSHSSAGMEGKAKACLQATAAHAAPVPHFCVPLGRVACNLPLPCLPAVTKNAPSTHPRTYYFPVPPPQSNLDHVVAMELWWRTAALQALLACITGPLAAAPRVEQAALYACAAGLLKPTLDVLTAHAALQVKTTAIVMQLARTVAGTAAPAPTCMLCLASYCPVP